MSVSEHPLAEKYDFLRVENMWSTLIMDVIASLIEREEMCDCQDCVLDVTALALNSLPPKYWVLGGYDAFSPPERFYGDPKNRRLAEEAVVRSLSLVQQNPHH